MNILVTGIGWLGTRFVELLTANNKEDNVRCLMMRREKVPYLIKKRCQIVRGDVREYHTLVDAVRDIDLVFHLAGVIHAKPKDLIETNFHGTQFLLSASLNSKVKKFIYVSSNSAVGHTNGYMMDEIQARVPYMSYGYSKYLAEELVQQVGLNRFLELDTVIIRPCWYYGPDQPKRQTKLFKMIKGGKPIIFGDGRNLRSMSYIDNVIQALLLAKEYDDSGQTFWIADKKPYTINEIYETIASLLNVGSYKPKHIPSFISSGLRKADVLIQKLGFYNSYIHVGGEMTLNIVCDISKARRELGYNPEIELEEGMRRSIKWCKDQQLL